MTRASLASASLFVIGLLAGSIAPANGVRAGTTPTADGYRILAGDFHVHAFPGDGALAPWDLAREARREGLDVMAITNHNQMVAARLASWTTAADGVMVLPGQEVTTPDFHVAAIGLRDTVDWHGAIPDIARAVHAQAAVLIGAHPAGQYLAAFDTAAFATLDGLERAHPMMEFRDRDRRTLADAFDRARLVKPSIAPIGSTDFHFTAAIGLCRTYVFVRETTPAGVLDAIRAGRTVACDQRGNVYGDAALTSQVVDRCRATAGARLTSSWLDRVSLACTWVGILGLAWTGLRRRE